MEGLITIRVDCHGHWVEKRNRYVWRWKEGEMLETIAMTVQSDVSYDDFVNLIISFCGLNCQPEEFPISYMHNSFENQRVLPFKITDQVRLRSYLSDSTRPVLRVYMVEKTRENENQNVKEEEKEDFFDDRLDDLDMNIPDDDQTPASIDATNTMCSSSQSTQSGNLQEDRTGFFIGIIKKWWLRVVKYESSDRFVIHKHEKHHTCGSEHISGQNSHATAKVLGEYFRSSFPNGKGPLTRLMANQLLMNLGVRVSYWKVYMAMGIAKDLVQGTLEHGYEVLDTYRYMIEPTNPGSKTTLHLDENGRFKYPMVLGFKVFDI
ncbi:hypothetical protein P3L10_016418 [Capsicum annuum]